MTAVGARGLRTRVDATVATIAGIAVVGFVLRVAVLVRPIGVIDKLFIPDDTYYTLTIARSLANGDGPTVDGSSLTSGFQALLGFLLVPVFWITDSPDTALRLDLALLVVADTATIIVLGWVAYRFAGRVAAVAAAALWAISPVAVSMALGGLETSLAILVLGRPDRAVDVGERPTATGRAVVVGVVAGLAGVGAHRHVAARRPARCAAALAGSAPNGGARRDRGRSGAGPVVDLVHDPVRYADPHEWRRGASARPGATVLARVDGAGRRARSPADRSTSGARCGSGSTSIRSPASWCSG